MPADRWGARRPTFEPYDGPERGATSVEYAIIASLVAAVIVAVVILLGLATEENFSTITDLWP
ncbi:MAG: Flp family type IVb pilin [Actinomycetes bacterium]